VEREMRSDDGSAMEGRRSDPDEAYTTTKTICSNASFF